MSEASMCPDGEFDDFDAEDWEGYFSQFELDETEIDALSSSSEEGESESESELEVPAVFSDIGFASADLPRLGIPVWLPTDALSWALESAPTRAAAFSGQNEFADPNRSQLIGLLGEAAFALWYCGDWRLARSVRPCLPDFGGIEVKTSVLPRHGDLRGRHLIEAESFPGHLPVMYPIYVQVFVDPNSGRAVIAGWCSGSSLFSRSKAPIPGTIAHHGLLMPVEQLNSMERFPRDMNF